MILNLSQTSWFASITHLVPLPSLSMGQWLTQPYVLGNALEKAHGKIQVQVLSEMFDEPFEHELVLLKNSGQDRPFFIREVYLKNTENILTYGRVVIPEVTFMNNKTKILELKDKSFGKHILYSHPNYTRGDFEYACTYYHGQPIWGRRSLFCLGADPLIVTEFYMVDLGPYPSDFGNVKKE